MRPIQTALALLAIAVLIGLGTGMAATAPSRASPRPTVPPPPSVAAEPPAALTEGAIGPVVTLDPQFATSAAEQSIAALLFRGLTRLGPDHTLLPDLAERWEVDAAGTAVTFFLRPDAYWHDGVHVSADDVMLTVRTLTDPSYPGAAAADWQGVTAERIDRFTVRLNLPVPFVRFESLTTVPLVPAHLLAEMPTTGRPGSEFSAAPVGTGPFAFEGVSRGSDGEIESVDLMRVGLPLGGPASTYGPGLFARRPEPTTRTAPAPRPQIERYRFNVYGDATALAEALAGERIDAATGLEASQLGPLSSRRDIDVLRYPGTDALALVPNLRVSTEPLFEASIRRSLSLAIDRGRIGAEVFSGSALPATTLFSPAAADYDAEASGEPVYDPAAARARLLAAGWTESASGWLQPGAQEPVSIEILVRDAPDAEVEVAVANLIAEDWEELGLDVAVVPVPVPELVTERVRTGAFEVALLPIELGLEPELLPLFISTEAQAGGSNIGAYQSTLTDRLLREAAEATSEGERQERLRALQAALARELPVITICFPDVLFLVNDRLSGQSERQVSGVRDRYWDVLAWRLVPRPDE